MLRNANSFSALLKELSSVRPQADHQQKSYPQDQGYSPLRILTCWLRELRQHFTPLPDGTARSIFRFLFPEQDVRRKYGMQERLLGSYVGEIFGIPNDKLQHWNSVEGSGCLGMELQRILAIRSSGDEQSSLSIADLDELLDELASTCEFSHSSLRLRYPAPRSRKAILRHLYCSLSPIDVSLVTQIILKDLRPLTQPLPTQSATLTLTGHNISPSCKPLCIADAMRVWDRSGRLLKAYSLIPVIDDAMVYYEDMRSGTELHVGAFIEIPKSRKGRGCSDALSYLRQSKRVWAETKYDGERAQIHIEMLPATEPRITIFSKSKRDSTQDRKAIHQIIRHAIECKVKQNVALDAEMVACHGNDVDEFWRIRGLLGDVPFGPSGIPGASNEKPNRHLGLVFFDVLILDSQPLVHLPYHQRRALLESLVRRLPGHIYLAERTSIDLDSEHPEQKLQEVFAHSIANFEEGIVIKAEESSYCDRNLPWVKLKKDYIPGFGDAVDLAILGTGWDKDRGRELRVPPTTYTSFFVGALMNGMEVRTNPSLKPHFYLSITASYGMTRKQLEELNFIINNSPAVTYDQFKSSGSFDYTVTLGPGLSMMPSIILKTPLLAELVGAGFTKPSGGEYYELRFPRIIRVFRESERSWKDGIEFQQMQDIAYRCVGNDKPFKDVEDWCNDLWGKNTSPSMKSRAKRKASAASWQNKLAVLDNESNKFRMYPALTSLKRKKGKPCDSGVTSDPCAHDRSEERLKDRSEEMSMELPITNATDLIRSLGEASLVWFSGESKVKAIWKQLTPSGHCLHTLESLLLGCGWHSIAPKREYGLKWVERIERGLAIVHDERWKKIVLETLSKYETGADSRVRKPILVIDAFEDGTGFVVDSFIRSIQGQKY